jgi:hypothetical protein
MLLLPFCETMFWIISFFSCLFVSMLPFGDRSADAYETLNGYMLIVEEYCKVALPAIDVLARFPCAAVNQYKYSSLN